MTTENQKTLRQADNVVEVEGIVAEIRIEERNIKGKPAITGEVDIQTAENSTHTFRVFAYKHKSDGSDSALYKGIETIKNEYKSIASVGKEEADKVRITMGQLGVNEYYGQDGQLKSFPQLSTNFINRLQAGEPFEPKAKFEVEAVITNVKPEKDKGEETGRAIIETVIPVYGGKVIPMTFVVADEDAVSYVENNYEKGNTVRLYGEIVNRVEVTKTEVSVGFGKPQEKVTRKTVRELLITGGSEPYDEDNKNAYEPSVIKAALAEREIYLEELKKKKEEGSNGDNKSKPEQKKGFNVNKKKEEQKPIDISDDDLPF